MKQLTYIFFIAIAVMFSDSLSAQNAKQDMMLDEIINVYNLNKRDEAISQLENLLKKYPDYERGYFVKGQWEKVNGKYPEAIKTLTHLSTINKYFNPLVYKFLAESYFYDKQYDEAMKWAKLFAGFEISPQNLVEINQLISNIEFAQNTPNESYTIKFENLGPTINTTEGEYFPSSTADEAVLYFTRKTKGDEDIWISQKNASGWNQAVRIDEPMQGNNQLFESINSYENDGAHTISPSGKYLFFTSCNRPGNVGSCDIYFSKLEGNKWGKPRILPSPVNTGAWESQPCISSDGNYLFFSSNREGGIGESDIYVSEISSKGEFSEPKNLGDVINTKGSEDRPFIHPDGKTLYFSSNGHPGLGGRDLFMSKLVNNAWTKPINLGRQINTQDDELSIFINTLGDKAYVAKQNTEGGRRDFDIYSFELPAQLRPEKTTYIKGIVVDSKTNKPLAAKVKLFDPSESKDIMSLNTDKVNGSFLMTAVEDKNYGFNVVSPGYSVFSNSFSFKSNPDGKPQEFVIKLEPLVAGTKFTLKNVFFETGKYDLMPSSTKELDNIVTILKESPDIKIRIDGHTDNVGSDASNLTLSENRAKAVMNYFIEKGIDAARLTSKGYGASKPIDSNDTESGRAKNRRTEIEII